jgi:hypothetical protein
MYHLDRFHRGLSDGNIGKQRAIHLVVVCDDNGTLELRDGRAEGELRRAEGRTK